MLDFQFRSCIYARCVFYVTLHGDVGDLGLSADRADPVLSGDKVTIRGSLAHWATAYQYGSSEYVKSDSIFNIDYSATQNKERNFRR